MTAPVGWKPRKLTELADFINGYAFKPDDWGKDGLKIVRIEQLRDPLGNADYFDGHVPPENIIDDGDLIFSWSASLLLRFWTHGTAALNQHLFKVVEHDGVDRQFLKFFIEFHLPELANAAHGSTMRHITRKELDRFVAAVPVSKDEQAAIGEILKTIDHLIDETERQCAKGYHIRIGLMQDVLSRGIDGQGLVRTEQTHSFKDSALGRIPAEWDAVPLSSLAEFVTSGSRGWAQYYSIEGPMFLRIGNLTRDHINLRFDDVVRVAPPESSEGKRTSVLPRDLLISITADLGIIGVIPEGFEEAYVNQHIALVRIDPDKANSRFLGWFLSSRGGQTQFERLNESGAKAGLNLPTIERLLVPTTKDPDEQGRIAQVLDAATRQADDTLRELQKLHRLKSGLMQDLLTGRKRVTPLLALATETAVQGV